jgi:hypothetical protein
LRGYSDSEQTISSREYRVWYIIILRAYRYRNGHTMPAAVEPFSICRALHWHAAKIVSGKRTLMPMGVQLQVRNPGVRHWTTGGEGVISTVKANKTTGE